MAPHLALRADGEPRPTTLQAGACECRQAHLGLAPRGCEGGDLHAHAHAVVHHMFDCSSELEGQPQKPAAVQRSRGGVKLQPRGGLWHKDGGLAAGDRGSIISAAAAVVGAVGKGVCHPAVKDNQVAGELSNCNGSAAPSMLWEPCHASGMAALHLQHLSPAASAPRIEPGTFASSTTMVSTQGRHMRATIEALQAQGGRAAAARRRPANRR